MLAQRHFPDCAFSPSFFSSQPCLFASFFYFHFTFSCIHPVFPVSRASAVSGPHSGWCGVWGWYSDQEIKVHLAQEELPNCPSSLQRRADSRVDPRGSRKPLSVPAGHIFLDSQGRGWNGSERKEVVSILQSPQGPLPWSTSLRACRDKIKANNAELRMQSVSILAEHKVLGSVPSNA